MLLELPPNESIAVRIKSPMIRLVPQLIHKKTEKALIRSLVGITSDITVHDTKGDDQQVVSSSSVVIESHEMICMP